MSNSNVVSLAEQRPDKLRKIAAAIDRAYEKQCSFADLVTNLKARIGESRRKTLSQVVVIGDMLIEAKAQCERGEFSQLIGRHDYPSMLPFAYTTAYRYISIAKHSYIRNCFNLEHFNVPIETTALGELAQIDDEYLEKMIEVGIVNADTSLDQARAARQAYKEEKKAAKNEKVQIKELTEKLKELEFWKENKKKRQKQDETRAIEKAQRPDHESFSYTADLKYHLSQLIDKYHEHKAQADAAGHPFGMHAHYKEQVDQQLSEFRNIIEAFKQE